MRIALFGSTFQTDKKQYVQRILSQLEQHDDSLIVEPTFHQYLSGLDLDMRGHDVIDSDAFSADLAMSVGGDGTFLKTAAAVGRKDIPIVGINTGRLGFLAEVSPDDCTEAIDALHCHAYSLESRSVIQAVNSERPFSFSPFALNEVAVLKHDNSSLIDIRTEINGELLTHYLADGLIISTPTGSTGYSLSAGGPIIVPDTRTLCLSAVAPHSLYIRPVVLSDDVTLTLSVESRSHNFLVAIDGRSESFSTGTTVTVRRAPYTVKIVKIHHRKYFDTLRAKMMWGADQRV